MNMVVDFAVTLQKLEKIQATMAREMDVIKVLQCEGATYY